MKRLAEGHCCKIEGFACISKHLHWPKWQQTFNYILWHYVCVRKEKDYVLSLRFVGGQEKAFPSPHLGPFWGTCINLQGSRNTQSQERSSRELEQDGRPKMESVLSPLLTTSQQHIEAIQSNVWVHTSWNSAACFSIAPPPVISWDLGKFSQVEMLIIPVLVFLWGVSKPGDT